MFWCQQYASCWPPPKDPEFEFQGFSCLCCNVMSSVARRAANNANPTEGSLACRGGAYPERAAAQARSTRMKAFPPHGFSSVAGTQPQPDTFTVIVGTVLPLVGHFLRGRSLKGRCNIRVYVPVCVPVCVCVCVCVPLLCPSEPLPYCGAEQQNPPPTPPLDPSPPFPHPYLQAIA